MVILLLVLIYIIAGQSKLRALIGTIVLQCIRTVEASQCRQISFKLQFSITKDPNDLQFSHSSIPTTEKDQEKYIILRTALF